MNQYLSLVELGLLAEAIADVESADHDLKVGENGERGRWQFQEQLWCQITPALFLAAHDPETARRVAVRHLEWLRKKLDPFAAHAVQPAVFLLALAWKAGPHAVLNNFASKAQREYAQKVAAEYDSLLPF